MAKKPSGRKSAGRPRPRAPDALLRALIQASPLAITTFDLDRSIVLWSPAAEAMFGWSEAEACGRSCPLVPRAKENEFRTMFECVKSGASFLGVETLRQRKDGTLLDVCLWAVPLRDSAGKIQGALGIFSDVSERTLTERRLRASEEQYRLLFEGNPHPMWVFDPETLRFIAVNEAAMRHYGYTRDEFYSMTIKDIRPPEDRPTGAEYAAWSGWRSPPGLGQAGVWKHRKKDGAIIDVDIVWGPIVFHGRNAILVLANDVTERVRLEAMVLQNEKLASVGQLAAGIAHELNNPLASILGLCQLLLQDGGLTPPQRHDLETVQAHSQRCRLIIQDLLQFARKREQSREPVGLLPLLDATIRLVHHEFSADGIEIERDMADVLPAVLADPSQLQQVFLNLITNAKQAMQGRKPARLRIQARFDEGRRLVLVHFQDNGGGIPRSQAPRIFDPFFTTKPVGQGTGLGLSICHSIMEQHRGAIRFRSEEGVGTTFTLELPAFQG